MRGGETKIIHPGVHRNPVPQTKQKTDQGRLRETDIRQLILFQLFTILQPPFILIAQTITMSESSLAVFTASDCQYNKNTLNINDLFLAHGGLSLFHNASFSINRGEVSGLVGINGAGKTSLSRILASKELPGFPQSLTVEYLAASDDEEFLAGTYTEDYNEILALKPLEYIKQRVKSRSQQLQDKIDELEGLLVDEEVEESALEAISDELSDLYEIQESLEESTKREMNRAISDLGLNDYLDKSLGDLSSGWRYKCRLVAAFLVHPDLLIIDEPSFLDSESTEWLISIIKSITRASKAMVLFISHKEALLDSLCDSIIYINASNHSITTYHVGYSQFRAIHEKQIEGATKTIASTTDDMVKAEKSLKHLKVQMKKREKNLKGTTSQNSDQRFIKGKNKEAKQKADKSAASRLKKAKAAVDDLESARNAAKKEKAKSIHIKGQPIDQISITLTEVGFRYDSNDDFLFQNVDVSVGPHDKILLKGKNGCGKSTLIKLILGELEPVEGSITKHGKCVYFPQTALSLLIRQHGNSTTIDYLGENLTPTEARHHLGDFGLTGDLSIRCVNTLSAGQRVRLWLAKECLKNKTPAILILDEISENVDIETRDSLLELLESFNGACIVISHDSDFSKSFKHTKAWQLTKFGIRETFPDTS